MLRNDEEKHCSSCRFYLPNGECRNGYIGKFTESDLGISPDPGFYCKYHEEGPTVEGEPWEYFYNRKGKKDVNNSNP